MNDGRRKCACLCAVLFFRRWRKRYECLAAMVRHGMTLFSPARNYIKQSTHWMQPTVALLRSVVVVRYEMCHWSESRRNMTLPAPVRPTSSYHSTDISKCPYFMKLEVRADVSSGHGDPSHDDPSRDDHVCAICLHVAKDQSVYSILGTAVDNSLSFRRWHFCTTLILLTINVLRISNVSCICIIDWEYVA